METKKLIKFLRELYINNDREWFNENRQRYLDLKKEFEILVQEVIEKTSTLDKSLSKLNAKDCLYRINRDVRFSKNKAPYNTHFSALLNPYGKKILNPSYYFKINQEAILTIAGGAYDSSTKDLQKIRKSIDKNPYELIKIIENKDFKNYYKELHQDQLKTSPRGYSIDNPNIELLKYKSYSAMKLLTLEDIEDSELVDNIIEGFKVISPLIKYLRDIVES